jgi:hypothetical protein
MFQTTNNMKFPHRTTIFFSDFFGTMIMEKNMANVNCKKVFLGKNVQKLSKNKMVGE